MGSNPSGSFLRHMAQSGYLCGYCGEGEGDCDADADCAGSLVCGTDNCVGDGFDDTDDCCRQPEGDEGENCAADNECAGWQFNRIFGPKNCPNIGPKTCPRCHLKKTHA